MEKIRESKMDIRLLEEEVVDAEQKAGIARDDLQEVLPDIDYLRRLYDHNEPLIFKLV